MARAHRPEDRRRVGALGRELRALRPRVGGGRAGDAGRHVLRGRRDASLGDVAARPGAGAHRRGRPPHVPGPAHLLGELGRRRRHRDPRRRRRHRRQRVLPAGREGGRLRRDAARGRRAGAREGARAGRAVGAPGRLHRDRVHHAPRSGRQAVGVARRDEPPARRRAGAGGGVPRARRAAARGAGLRGVLRLARLRGPGRRVAGGPLGLLAARQARGAGRARRVRRALGVRPLVFPRLGAPAATTPGLYP